MSTSTTKTKPPGSTKLPPAAKPEAPVAIPLGLPALVALSGQSSKKVRFPDRETAARGFGVLSRSGLVIEALGNYTFGVGSTKQLSLLRQAGLRFEVVE